MNFLKQSTSVIVRVGPFVDATDNVTPETGITLGAADEAEVLKAAGAAVVDISSNTWAAITNCNGWYNLTLTASDTDTVGQLVVVIQDLSVCLPVYCVFQVIEEAIYDALLAPSAGGFDSSANVTIDALPTSADSYWSKTTYTRDTGNSQDEHRTIWFKNDEPLTSGVTLAKLWVVDDASNDKIGSAGSPASMTEVGSDHVFLYNATAAGEKVAAGIGLATMTYATIDSVERKWREVFSRDT